MKPNDAVKVFKEDKRWYLKQGKAAAMNGDEVTVSTAEKRVAILSLAIRSLGGLDRVKMKYILNGRNSLGIPLNEQGTEAIAQALITAYNEGRLFKEAK